MTNLKRQPPVRLPWTVSVLLFLLLTAGVTLLALWCQPNPLPEVLEIFRQKPVLYALNALPVGLLILIAAFLFGNLFRGTALACFVVWGFSIANRLKIEIRDEPVFPRDIAMLKEVGSAAGNYGLQFPVVNVLAGLAAVLLLILLGIFIGHKPFPLTGAQSPASGPRASQTRFPLSRLRGWAGRLAGAAVSLGILAALTLTVYSSDDLYNNLGASSPYRLSVVFNENGFPYNFFHQMTKYQVDRPAGYSKSTARAWDEGTEGDWLSGGTGNAGTSRAGTPVNVVVVMNEAFSDITDDPAFAYTDEDTPLRNLHALQRDPHALSLRLIVPGFAGGTANTEFDVLTGMQTNALSLATTSAMRTVNRNLDSPFRVYGAAGYRTSFFHPGNDWFYNRENVYRWLGAEETVFIDQMYVPVYKGSWVTDDYMAGLIAAELDRAAEEGRPLFHYTTTIQNHMAYVWNKYGETYSFPPVPLNVEVPDEVQLMLRVYAEGARDADAMLGRLAADIGARAEPYVLVFFGDHLPYLGDNRLCYEALGMDVSLPDGERENEFSIYEVPCVIWANGAAAEALDWERAAASLDLPENGKLSASFLGAVLLELTGQGRATPWTAFLNHLRREVPVVQRNLWMLPDGTVTEAREDTPAAEDIRVWRQWSYYKLMQKELR